MHCQIIPRTSLQPSARSALGAAMAAVLQIPVPCEGCQGWGQRCPSRGMHRGRSQSISEWDKSSKTDSKRIGHALLFLSSFCFLPTCVKRCVSFFQPSFSRLGRSQFSSHRMSYSLFGSGYIIQQHFSPKLYALSTITTFQLMHHGKLEK